MMDDAKRTDRTRDLIHGIITKREFIGEMVREAYDRGYEDAFDSIISDVILKHWGCVKDDNYSGGGYWECPKCKDRFSFQGFNLLNDMPYCPRCGSRVKTELEAENEKDEHKRRIAGGIE